MLQPLELFVRGALGFVCPSTEKINWIQFKIICLTRFGKGFINLLKSPFSIRFSLKEGA
jgi:hypothetical protein